ncbi:Septation ring formation regulator EzrA [Streptococcus gordonii]|uniref:Septation ring formation regulator EzrA n=1 Tax=Streptococcus gordonii (strain Challis / ATCC 35105 / BCRC 15272 / CH1 / DL1 / V288) TaxID=467705 RepID=EZRA_STRGC|nr:MULTISPECIES: septation ring formation regulator EzrA [Streptococcus]A8AY51.1 RecName: Full=Septation ring formation regulator EzrA [Streptococcus gordonii str. Challis substr. CH1]ABV09556.1 Septation ring formation regulator ezrA [Streptococcus gordonii str. Challis substr. CH1]MBZ2137161.1 septation ring formation regulator EzrA [Streptococcus gordonii]MCC3175676.1 septation ring formation regulator, EzrA family protein [Streptococcus gordonii]MCY7138893.1 septation ring formation regula
MSNGLIILIIVIAVALILAYVAAVVLRKRNETLLDSLEERKEKLYNLPVNDEVEAIKNMHLIGQSQVTFREWNQKWVDLSLNSFADIENNIFEAEGYNNSFRFLKAKHAIDSIESQINLVEEDIELIREALADLEKQEAKNSGRVLHALELFENLQVKVAEDTEKYGPAVQEIQKQLQNIESEFSQFVTLNSSGDPVEAADILDKTENHILALTHIVDKVPSIVTELREVLPDQLEDLESGYRKLVEAGYHFVETDIESRFSQLHSNITQNYENIAALELDNAQYENTQIQEEINALYDIFTREIAAQKVVEKLQENLPAYLKHTKENNQHLQSELDRLSKMYLLSDEEDEKVRDLQSELSALEAVVLATVEDSAENKQAYSLTQEALEATQERLKEIEDEQITLGERLERIEKDDDNARQKVNIYINKLHTIKRYMEKRNLPGIPKSFLSLFFTASDHTEALLTELEQLRVNIDNVNLLLENVTNDIHDLETETYQIVQYATLTEQLLQYSNRYRSFDQSIQEAFNKALDIFENQFDYESSFEVISQALEVVEPGVTSRFVTSYEKTRENIRF